MKRQSELNKIIVEILNEELAPVFREFFEDHLGEIFNMHSAKLTKWGRFKFRIKRFFNRELMR